MSMTKFEVLTGIAAPLPESHVDTDIIFPARFLLLPNKKGLAAQAFYERRHGKPGAAPFVLDTEPYTKATILVAGGNFGTGSSREQAVWCLADFGIRCVIAPSFGEIFFANCFKNGVLPVVLGDAAHGRVMAAAQAGEEVTVDLPAQVVRLADGTEFAFEIEAYRKRALLLGLDEIGMILEDDLVAIKAFEARQKVDAPWLYLTKEQLSFFDDADRNAAA